MLAPPGAAACAETPTRMAGLSRVGRAAASHERPARWEVLVPSMVTVSGGVSRLCLHSQSRGNWIRLGQGLARFVWEITGIPGETPALAAVLAWPRLQCRVILFGRR